MKTHHKITFVIFLAISLVIWSAPSEARRGHKHSGHDRRGSHGSRFHGSHGFHGSHHFYRGHYSHPHHWRGHGYRHYRGHHHGYGHKAHFGIVLHFHKALEYARSNEATTWRNPDSGGFETVTPYKTYQTDSGRYCREFVKTVTIGGEQHQAYGTACRQPDGSWEIINN